jgi:hypothetical protein
MSFHDVVFVIKLFEVKTILLYDLIKPFNS